VLTSLLVKNQAKEFSGAHEDFAKEHTDGNN